MRRLILRTAEARVLWENGEAVVVRRCNKQPRWVPIDDAGRECLSQVSPTRTRDFPYGNWVAGEVYYGSSPSAPNQPPIICSVTAGENCWIAEEWQMSGLCWPHARRGLGRLHYKCSDNGEWKKYWGKWRYSSSMPKWASRQSAKIVTVTAKQARDIPAVILEGSEVKTAPGDWCWVAEIKKVETKGKSQ